MSLLTRTIALLILWSVATTALAQDPKLIEAAKKEGRLVLYGTMQTDIFELLHKAFQKKTGITIDYWRTSATKVTERALSEARAGKALFDLVMSTEDTTRIMLKEGILAKYDSPMSKDFPKDAIDPELGPRARNHHRHSLQQEHHQTRRCAEDSGGSCQAPIPWQTGYGRPDTTHDHGPMARQCAQTDW